MAGTVLVAVTDSVRAFVSNTSFFVQNASSPQSPTIIATAPSSPYTHGLTGVNQIGNYFFINMLVIFFSILCAVLLVERMRKYITNYWRFTRAAGTDADRQICLKYNYTSLWPWIKRHVLLAPLFGSRHNRAITINIERYELHFGTIPLRFQSIILATYVISNISYCLVLKYHQAERAAMFAELRGRSGALASMNLVPTVLFAMRSNPFIYLLGVSYDTFNLFHRWAARTTVLLSIIHVSAWATDAMSRNGGEGVTVLLRTYTSLAWAAVAMTMLLIIAFQAWSPIRHACYEFFLAAHRLLVLFALIGVYIHLDKGKLPQLPYVWLVMIIWVAEWIIRSLRLLRWNCSRKTQTMVQVEPLPNEACRLTFTLARPWTYKPGSHVYIMLPQIQTTSMHSFSVAWSNDTTISNPFDDSAAIALDDFSLDKLTPKITTTPVTTGTAPHTPKSTEISLIIRARTGMTARLHAHATTLARSSPSPSNPTVSTLSCKMPAYIDGPYGTPPDTLTSYGTVLLFAGGVGITHQLGFVRHLVRGYAAKTVAARKVVLVWSMQDRACLGWVQPWLDEILAVEGYRDVLSVRLFVTRKGGGGGSGEGRERPLESRTGTLRMTVGRCVVREVVDEIFADRVGAMVVTVCGPGAFADGVREAVRGRVEEGSLEFVEEGFSY